MLCSLSVLSRDEFIGGSLVSSVSSDESPSSDVLHHHPLHVLLWKDPTVHLLAAEFQGSLLVQVVTVAELEPFLLLCPEV